MQGTGRRKVWLRVKLRGHLSMSM